MKGYHNSSRYPEARCVDLPSRCSRAADSGLHEALAPNLRKTAGRSLSDGVRAGLPGFGSASQLDMQTGPLRNTGAPFALPGTDALAQIHRHCAGSIERHARPRDRARTAR